MQKQQNMIRNILITVYILVVLSISATARASMTIDPIFTGYKPVASQTYIGEVAMTPNRDFFLVVSESQVYQLAANVDLIEFNGLTVEVDATELKHVTGPVQTSSSLDPLPRTEDAVAVPVLVVFGISEVAN